MEGWSPWHDDRIMPIRPAQIERAWQVLLYSMFGQRLPKQFSMGSEVASSGVLECCTYGEGVAVLTHALELWAVCNLDEPRPQRFAQV